jgi:hypothetical protein
MDPLFNPYGPGAGTPPPELSGREAVLEEARLALGRLRRGMPHKSFILAGLRGVGKTVLLGRIDEIARELGYHSVFIEHTEDKTLGSLLLPQLRRVLYELDRLGAISGPVKRAFRILRSFAGAIRVKTPGDVEFSIDVDPEIGTADSGDLETDLTELFTAIGEAARDRETCVCVIIDELQYLKPAEFSSIIMAVHRTNQRKLPLILIGAGLPQVVGLAGKSKSYAERLFNFLPVGPLDAKDATDALAAPARRADVDFDARALDELVHATQGYPYFIQEWGYHTWNTAPRSPITSGDVTAAGIKAVQRLDESFFKVRFERLTPSEKRYLRAMAELGPGPHRSGDIAAIYGTDVMKAGPTRAKLIAKGMIYSPAHGDNAFTVPLFDQYLKRVLPAGVDLRHR